MIRNTDLRVGNLVLIEDDFFDDNGKFNKSIHRISFHDLGFEQTQFHPIILDEEILLKCGFWSTSNYFDMSIEGIDIGYITNDDFFQCEVFGKVIDIKYLHQLQNLYFALTGQELNTSEL